MPNTQPSHRSTTWYYWLLVAIGIVIADQLSKYVALHTLDYAQPYSLLPFLNFTLVYNHGAAFSFLANQQGWQVFVLAAIAVVVTVMLVIWLRRLQGQHAWLACGLSFILGGALGNLIDRLVHGYVTDFVDFHIHDWHFACFNVADAAITIGAGLLLIDFFIKRDKVQQRN